MAVKTVNRLLKEKYGTKVYKIALNGGFTCPNRDGRIGYGGCTFCSGSGSGDFAESGALTVTEQIEAGKRRVAAKMPKAGGKYIAYFQAFTNTYAPVEKLRELFTEAVRHPDIVIISIATRPDCLPPEVIGYLAELNRIKPVWVELGLQTIHEETARRIRRGYPLSVYDKAVSDLRAAGIYTVVHMIVGLPGESRTDIIDTADYIGRSGVQGIKIQLLHVLEGTDLAEKYRRGAFRTLTMEEYVSIVVECIAVLPDDITIHRMTGDGDRKKLIAPMWSLDKKRVLNALRKRVEWEDE